MSADTNMEIFDLIQRIIRDPKDERALDVLIDKLRGPALAWIQDRFRILSEIDADAIFFDAIYRLYTNAKSITGTTGNSVKSFFYKIMKNLALDLIEEMKRDEGWLIDLDDERPGNHEEENKFSDHWVDNVAAKNGTQKSIEKTLELRQGLAELRSQLTDTEKKVFDNLAAGIPRVEIAEKYHLTRGRVSQICKAISKKANLILGE